jgi:hypothetical protein
VVVSVYLFFISLDDCRACERVGVNIFFPLALDTSDKNPDDWSVDHTCSPGWMVFALCQLASALLHLFLSRSVFHENFCKDSNFFGFQKMREIKAKCEFFPLKIRVILFYLIHQRFPSSPFSLISSERFVLTVAP